MATFFIRSTQAKSVIQRAVNWELSHVYDHRHWILDAFLKSRQRNPRRSLRSFAKQLGVSHSALSEILSGKRALSQKRAVLFAERMGLSADEARNFARAAWIAKLEAKLPKDQETNDLTSQNFQPLEVETFNVIADWYHFAILCLLEIRGFECTSENVSRRLNIPPSDAKDALRRLERMGIITRRDGKYLPPQKPLSIYTEGYDMAMRSLLQQHLRKAIDSLDHHPASQREISSTTMAIDPRNIEKARDAVKRFRREMASLLERGKKSRVYVLSVQLVPADVEET